MSSSALQRLLERTLPDDSQVVKLRRARKSRAARKSKAAKQAESRQMKTVIDKNYNKELKEKTAEKNVSALLSWEHPENVDGDEDADELQRRLIESRKLSTGPRPKKTVSSKMKSWPGLTPGLAPVGYESSDEEDLE